MRISFEARMRHVYTLLESSFLLEFITFLKVFTSWGHLTLAILGITSHFVQCCEMCRNVLLQTGRATLVKSRAISTVPTSGMYELADTFMRNNLEDFNAG
jgi:hypothetical protein